MPQRLFPIGERIELPGHFTDPVVLEEVRALGEGSECRVRLTDGSLEEVVLSHEETVALADHTVAAAVFATVDARDFQLLVESARIRLAYPHDRLYVVWDPLGPNHRLVKIQNPYGRLEHAVKCREVIRRYEVPAAAIDAVRSNDGQPNPNL